MPAFKMFNTCASEEENYQINLALRESQQTTRIQSDQLSVVHGTRSISGAPDFRFSQDYTVVNAPSHGRSSTCTTTINTASEENTLSLLP